MDLEELIEKWSHIGLLDGLPKEFKGNAAMIYEKTANILISEYETHGDNPFLTTGIFPVIYRISKTGLIIKNVPDLVEKFREFINDNRQVMTDFWGTDFDVEAEMCRLFVEDYCEWIIDNPEMDPIRYIPKHRL